MGVLESHLGQLGGQSLTQNFLFFCGGDGIAVFVRLGIIGYVTEKPFCCAHFQASFLHPGAPSGQSVRVVY